jgi:hypothetical protein
LGHTRLSDYNKQMLAITKETIWVVDYNIAKWSLMKLIK